MASTGDERKGVIALTWGHLQFWVGEGSAMHMRPPWGTPFTSPHLHDLAAEVG